MRMNARRIRKMIPFVLIASHNMEINIWYSIDFEPPDELLKIQDDNGNEALAYPTIYPFSFNKEGKLFECEPFWDGGWLIECDGLTSNIDSEIVKWKKIT